MAGTCCFLQQVKLVVVVLVAVELSGVCSLVLLDQVDGEASSSTGGKKLNNWRAASPPDPPMVKSYTPLVTRVGTRYFASALICSYFFAPSPSHVK